MDGGTDQIVNRLRLGDPWLLVGLDWRGYSFIIICNVSIVDVKSSKGTMKSNDFVQVGSPSTARANIMVEPSRVIKIIYFKTIIREREASSSW